MKKAARATRNRGELGVGAGRVVRDGCVVDDALGAVLGEPLDVATTSAFFADAPLPLAAVAFFGGISSGWD